MSKAKTTWTCLLLLTGIGHTGAGALAQGFDSPNELGPAASPSWYCGSCRAPLLHPSDFGNFGYNLARLPGNGLSFDSLDNITVVNSRGQSAFVDLAFGAHGVKAMGIEFPLIPNGHMVIQVEDDAGNITTYTTDLDDPDELSVGVGCGPGSYAGCVDDVLNGVTVRGTDRSTDRHGGGGGSGGTGGGFGDGGLGSDGSVVVIYPGGGGGSNECYAVVTAAAGYVIAVAIQCN